VYAAAGGAYVGWAYHRVVNVLRFSD
jgi:hypothetical protein